MTFPTARMQASSAPLETPWKFAPGRQVSKKPKPKILEEEGASGKVQNCQLSTHQDPLDQRTGPHTKQLDSGHTAELKLLQQYREHQQHKEHQPCPVRLVLYQCQAQSQALAVACPSLTPQHSPTPGLGCWQRYLHHHALSTHWEHSGPGQQGLLSGHPCALPGVPTTFSTLLDCWFTQRCPVCGERGDNPILLALESLHRPTRTSKQMDQESGKSFGEESQICQDRGNSFLSGAVQSNLRLWAPELQCPMLCQPNPTSTRQSPHPHSSQADFPSQGKQHRAGRALI